MTIKPDIYGFLRVGVCSPELKVADVEFNVNEIAAVVNAAVKQKASIVLFPELAVTGYTCGDLFFQESLLNSSVDSIIYLSEYIKTKKITAIVGFPLSLNGRIYNCAAVLDENGIAGIVPKTYLPGSNQYYEERWFSSANDVKTDAVSIGNTLVPFGTSLLFSNSEAGLLMGVEICEDLWSVNPPSNQMAVAGANLIVNPSSSDEHLGKVNYRRDLVRMQSGRCLSAYAYASSGPGESTTDLVFSGHCLVAENGSMIAESSRYNFQSQLTIADIDLQKLNHERLINNSYAGSKTESSFRLIPISFNQSSINNLYRPLSRTPFIPSDISIRNETCREIFNIQSTGLAKRIKHVGIKNVVIGVSGGLDSTLALLVALEAFRKLRINLSGIHTISMPGPGTSDQTKENARNLAKLLKTTFQEISITDAFNSHLKDIGHPNNKHDITFENAQARERTQILMDYANKVNGIVIGTGDLSELALGWATFNGDHMSMYGVNSSVPKTLIQYIIRWCADEYYKGHSELLLSILDTPISPELLPPTKTGKISQKTEDTVGPYILNDFFLYHFIRTGCSPTKLFVLARLAFKGDYSDKFILDTLKKFYSRFFANQFKRSTLPDGPRVGTVSLSPRGDWRMPSDASVNLWMSELDSLG
jgi:NAD+ synthase (glutamine-hydrolysing)